MRHTIMKAMKVAAAVPAAVVVAGAPAQAYMQADYGSAVRVQAWSSTVKIMDRACDGKGAQAQWQRTGSSTVYEKDNDGGCGTSLSVTTGGKVTQIRACLVLIGQSDPCSGWTSKQY